MSKFVGHRAILENNKKIKEQKFKETCEFNRKAREEKQSNTYGVLFVDPKQGYKNTDAVWVEVFKTKHEALTKLQEYRPEFKKQGLKTLKKLDSTYFIMEQQKEADIYYNNDDDIFWEILKKYDDFLKKYFKYSKV